ncbi:MAG: hypothetical protein H0T65_25170, partial [Deltaproteobacteria bacterium]|nr:hypothetical protein [Deltaproteobacteria bacterium]
MRHLAILSVIAACGGPHTSSTENPTFEEFEARTYKEPWPGGVYIINGDTPVNGKKALREIWERNFS